MSVQSMVYATDIIYTCSYQYLLRISTVHLTCQLSIDGSGTPPCAAQWHYLPPRIQIAALDSTLVSSTLDN